MKQARISAGTSFDLARKVRAEGGFTCQLGEYNDSVVFHTPADGGYGVALPGHELRLKLAAYTDLQLSIVIEAFVDANAYPLSLNGVHFGAWVDDGYLYLDVSEIVQYESLAAKLTHERGELAYWDFAQRRAVKVTEYDWRTLAGISAEQDVGDFLVDLQHKRAQKAAGK